MGTAGRKSSRRALMLAMVFGAISAILVLSYLRGAGQSDDSAVVTAPAVFAVRDIQERTVIKEGMLEVRQIPVDGRHELALREKSAAVGQIARQPISEGEQVLTNKIADQVRDVGFSANIPEGKRAVAVGTTEVIATGGNISPGDYVDVIGLFLVFQPKAGAERNVTVPKELDEEEASQQVMAVTILQNVQVLAVAHKTDQTLNPGGDKKASEQVNDAKAKSVTLSVTPEQAEKLFLAEETGRLRLSLRRFGDDEQRKIDPVINSLGEMVGQ
jgi:pilus assembly protein CpaB